MGELGLAIVGVVAFGIFIVGVVCMCHFVKGDIDIYDDHIRTK